MAPAEAAALADPGPHRRKGRRTAPGPAAGRTGILRTLIFASAAIRLPGALLRTPPRHGLRGAADWQRAWRPQRARRSWVAIADHEAAVNRSVNKSVHGPPLAGLLTGLLTSQSPRKHGFSRSLMAHAPALRHRGNVSMLPRTRRAGSPGLSFDCGVRFSADQMRPANVLLRSRRRTHEPSRPFGQT